MKTILTLLLLLPSVLLAQISEKFASVSIQINHENMIAFLNENGIEIDHVHQSEKDKIEVVITHHEISLLEELGVTHKVLIEDLTLNYLETLNKLGPNFSLDCGLDNFDTGEMGGYHSYQDMIDHINLMQSNHPDIVQVTEVGTSVEGRIIHAVKISDNVMANESDTEGVVYYDALTHAREPMGLETILYYMWSLLENYNTDPELTYLVNNREIYFIPVVNPDGYVFNQSTAPNGGGFWRKNRRVNAEGCTGIDLNRNYSYEWSNPAGSNDDSCSDQYHGPSAFSEPETQAVKDFITLIQPSAAFSNHSFSDVFLCPNGFNDDLDRYEDYSEFASEFIPQYYKGYGNWVQTIGYYGAGTTHDYLNSEGIIAYTPEIGHTFWEAPSDICDRVTEMYPAMKYLTWISGEYPRFHDFEKISEDPILEGNITDIKVRIKNRGISLDATNVVLELSSDFTGISFINDVVVIENIAPRSFADNNDNLFSFITDAPVLAGQEIPITVKIYQDEVLVDEEEFSLFAGEGNILFEEDGEDGMGQWEFAINPELWDSTFIDAVGGSHCITDTRNQNTPQNSHSLIHISDPITLSPDHNNWLEFYAKWSFEPDADYARVLYSDNDGSSWTPLEGLKTTELFGEPSYTNNSHWIQERIQLPDFTSSESIKIGFEIITDFGLLTDGFYFDNLRVVAYTDSSSVSIVEESIEKHFRVYPNPTQDELVVDFLNPNEYTYRLNLTNANGSVIFDKTNASKNVKIDLSSYPNGVYWLTIQSESQYTTKKVVKLK